MKIPFEPTFFGVVVNIHLILEYLAFFVAFRYYVWLRRRNLDSISRINRLSIILGAIIGAYFGSRIMGFLENPIFDWSPERLGQMLETKSIMGGLFGGLIAVEITKRIIKEKQSSGDLFVFPIILGIAIGRIGCFLSGMNEFTYGIETDFFMGMDLGDGKLRHPTSLYEIIFLGVLFVLLMRCRSYIRNESGLLFRVFMVAYFGFRFFIEFIKPNVFFIAGLSSIQWLCIICWIYYTPTLKKQV